MVTTSASNVKTEERIAQVNLRGKAADLLIKLVEQEGKDGGRVLSDALGLYEWFASIQCEPGLDIALTRNGKVEKILRGMTPSSKL